MFHDTDDKFYDTEEKFYDSDGKLIETNETFYDTYNSITTHTPRPRSDGSRTVTKLSVHLSNKFQTPDFHVDLSSALRAEPSDRTQKQRRVNKQTKQRGINNMQLKQSTNADPKKIRMTK